MRRGLVGLSRLLTLLALLEHFCYLPAFASQIRSQTRSHKVAYKPTPGRGEHIDIKVTPPGARGVDGRVLVEVYNRGKAHLALVQFDVVLTNRGGFAITAPVKAEDLRPNMSGSQWVKIPSIKGAFPIIDQAIVENLKMVNTEAREIKMKGFVDLIRN
jgi:hypothetical protein